jgi:hypothetical protein
LWHDDGYPLEAGHPYTLLPTDMPTVAIRHVIAGIAAALVGGALYLYLVRGPAMLLDAAAAAGRMFCL